MMRIQNEGGFSMPVRHKAMATVDTNEGQIYIEDDVDGTQLMYEDDDQKVHNLTQYIDNSTDAGTSITVTDNTYHNEVLFLSSTSAVTVTLGGANVPAVGFQCTIIKTGASGSITFAAGTSPTQTVNKVTGTLDTQYGAVNVYYSAANTWYVTGNLV
jgi:hypothetical protein